jgi:hypothetical protein
VVEEEEDKEEVCVECPVYLMAVEEGEARVRTDCGHEYHDGCLGRWADKCRGRGLPLTCPYCRRELAEEDS